MIKSALRLFQNINDMSVDDILYNFGLERRRSLASQILPALGAFGAGMLLGVGVGFLFAPVSGREARDRIGQRVTNIKEKVVHRAEEARKNGAPTNA